jgi:hypothetical protein
MVGALSEYRSNINGSKVPTSSWVASMQIRMRLPMPPLRAICTMKYLSLMMPWSVHKCLLAMSPNRVGPNTIARETFQLIVIFLSVAHTTGLCIILH